MRFFVYDPTQSIRTFDNFAAAVQCAITTIAEYFDEEDGWLDGVEHICMGIVTAQSELVDDPERGAQFSLVDYLQETVEELGGIKPDELAGMFAPPAAVSAPEEKLVDLLRQSRTALVMANERFGADRRAVGVHNQIRGVLKKIDELLPKAAAAPVVEG